jgi:hypothetical protein
VSGLIHRAMGRRSLSLVAVVVASGAILGTMTGTAGAAKATPVKSTVKITSTSATKFTGKVTSSKKACEKGRKVTLYRQTSARLLGADGPDYPGYEPLGTATTNASGNWEADAANGFSEFLEGTYRASVAPKRVTAGGHSWLCSPFWGMPTPA